MPTCVKFTFAHKIEAMSERPHVSVKVESRSTSRLISTIYILPILFTWLKFTCVNVHSQKRVSGNQPLSTVSKHLLLGLPLKICRTIPRGLVVQAMDFGASNSGFEARLCHLIFYLFGIECCYSTKILASATHPTLLWAPIFHQQEDEDNGSTFFNAGGLRRVFAS